MSGWVRALTLCFAVAATPAPAAEPVTLTAADGVKLFGTYSGTGDKTKPIILLFHMAGSNAAEYAPALPRFNTFGFNALAIDQRSGGNNFGRANATVTALGHSTGYRAALADLEAALAWARNSGHTGRIVVCGSSYSAALVFLLAARHPGEIAGLMAFSPGEYLGNGGTVRDAAAKLKDIAVFVTSASSRDEIAAGRAIVAAVPGPAKTQLVPRRAPHGVSALRSDSNPEGQAEVWAAVEKFLAPLR